MRQLKDFAAAWMAGGGVLSERGSQAMNEGCGFG